VCVVNPGPRTRDQLASLIDAAYAEAARHYPLFSAPSESDLRAGNGEERPAQPAATQPVTGAAGPRLNDPHLTDGGLVRAAGKVLP
jgi:hypothetical protein